MDRRRHWIFGELVGNIGITDHLRLAINVILAWGFSNLSRTALNGREPSALLFLLIFHGSAVDSGCVEIALEAGAVERATGPADAIAGLTTGIGAKAHTKHKNQSREGPRVQQGSQLPTNRRMQPIMTVSKGYRAHAKRAELQLELELEPKLLRCLGYAGWCCAQ